MQPSEEDFKEWRGHPVSEWVFAQMTKFAEQQKHLWSQGAWETGEAAQDVLSEARVRADCYKAMPESEYEAWKAIDDSAIE